MGLRWELTFNSDGFKAILNSEGVKGAVESAAAGIQERANANLTEDSEGYSMHSWTGNYGGGRWVASVSTTDYASQKAEAENKCLSRAVTG